MTLSERFPIGSPCGVSPARQAGPAQSHWWRAPFRAKNRHDMNLRERQTSRTMVTVLLLAWFVAHSAAFAAESNATAVTLLFAADEAVLSQNTDVVLRRVSALPIDQQFDYLTTWVLPSTTRSAFRMKAIFEQTDPAPILKPVPNGSKVSGIVSPVFALIAVAKEIDRLDELREHLEAISDSPDPDQLRARVALLFMVQVAQKDAEGTAESLVRLTELVKSRGGNQGGKWWPETLALAYGVSEKANRIEILDLATSIYDRQIGQSLWSGDTAWDIFIAASHATLSQAGNNETKSDRSTQASFDPWISASTVTAKSRGGGCPAELWQPSGNVVQKIAGHNNDYLYFPTPITGNFDIECDVTSFYYRETQLSYAGVYTSHYWTLNEAEVGDIRSKRMLPLSPPLTYPDKWLSSRISVRDGICRHFLNGRLILERTLSDGEFPWAALRSYRLSHGAIRNLTITGTPEIPRTVRMVTSSKLPGWYSYFDEVVDNADDSFSWLCTPDTDGALEIRHRAAQEFAGTTAESLLMYHRPMMEDGHIEYEFLYVPGETLVHPAIDRLTFILEPDGVKTHWVTDRQFQREELPSDNRSVEADNRRGRTELSLKANEWNRLQFALKGNVVQIRLNGSTVFEKSIETLNRRQFGLFHFCDESSVRVRNIRWTGDWSESAENLPRIRPDVVEIERAVAALPDSFHHDFRNSNFPDGRFLKRGETVTATDDGVLVNVAGTGWTSADLPVMLQITGDFDVRASFHDFHPEPTGISGVLIVAALEGTGQEIRFSRTQEHDSRQQIKIETTARKPDGQMQSESSWLVCETPDGTLRIVRLGETVYYLIAENDSSVFRLVGTEKIGTQDVRMGGLSVSMISAENGNATALWTDLSVKAEKLSGPALFDNEKIVSELNEQRDKLPASFTFDFTQAGPDSRNLYRWGDKRPWNAADMGLKLESEGVEGWTANGMMTRQVMDGDFDVTLTFDPTEMAKPTTGRYTSVFCQIQLQEDDRMRLASIFLRTPDEYKVVAQKHYTVSPGKDEYSWHGEVPMESVTALRMARRSRTYSMLAKTKESEDDRIVFQTDHSVGPAILHFLLHTGAVKERSEILLKTIEIHAEKYQPENETP